MGAGDSRDSEVGMSMDEATCRLNNGFSVKIRAFSQSRVVETYHK